MITQFEAELKVELWLWADLMFSIDELIDTIF